VDLHPFGDFDVLQTCRGEQYDPRALGEREIASWLL